MDYAIKTVVTARWSGTQEWGVFMQIHPNENKERLLTFCKRKVDDGSDIDAIVISECTDGKNIRVVEAYPPRKELITEADKNLVLGSARAIPNTK